MENRCPLCPGKYKPVPPSGPTDSPYMFIGEAPGVEEDRKGCPFVGKTGREVNEHYLPLAGLKRDAVYFTNAIRCLPDRPQHRLDLNREKDKELLLSCSSHHLAREIEEVNPNLIVPQGVLACHFIDQDMSLDLQHGIPMDTAWGKVFPMYHSAGGLHEPKKMLLIRNDWVRLGKYIKGKLQIPQDSFSESVDYRQIHHSEILEDCLECNDYTSALACDTEVDRFRQPFCLSYSVREGTGRLVRASGKEALRTFQEVIDQWSGPILFHNWLFDQGVTADMGLRFPQHKIVDTMVRAYHLGNLPQGLKALAYRLLGMKMQDFDDLVTPYSTPLCLSYMREALAHDWPKPEASLRRDEQGQWKHYQPQAMSTKLKRFLTDYAKNPSKDVFKSWDNWEDDHQLIESVCGPFPGKDIRHVPIDKTIHYACRDADATLRLWPVLQYMTRQVRRKLSEHWGDAA